MSMGSTTPPESGSIPGETEPSVGARVCSAWLDGALNDEIKRVEAMFTTTYRRGISAGLRDYRAKVAGNFSRASGPPAHYTDRSARTWSDGRRVGWGRAMKIENDFLRVATNWPGTPEGVNQKTATTPPVKTGEG